jgi:16S rRNA A1518/A1519 N6-dimethyltransferase RsmA/KsgA/DIM1 with predicted DNA glycosylase/AP lyase activity
MQYSPLLTMESVDEHTYSPPPQVDFALIIFTFDTKKIIAASEYRHVSSSLSGFGGNKGV